MSKKNNSNKLKTEKELAKFMEQVNKQDFKSDEELNNFLEDIMGQSFDDLEETPEERAQDLVYEAYEQPVSKAKKLIKQALELDPNNADAYNYLASIEKNVDKAIKLYEKVIKAEEKKLGKKFFKEEKGYFWGMLETRSYMRAKAGLAECLYAKNEIDKAIEIYEEMLELNPNDNQGVRYLLSTLLLKKKDLTKFEAFIKNSEEEDCAVWNFNNALYNFMKKGATNTTNKSLLKAHHSNEFVIDYMLGIKKMPKEPPRYISWGDENEAIAYVYDSWEIWENTEGALEWLYSFKQKLQKMN